MIMKKPRLPESSSLPARAARLTRGHINDLTTGLAQQMFFWGRDVLTAGNLLLQYGFQKRASTGLQGTSCYSLPWAEGLIELHGACAGWYPHSGSDKTGFLFIRHDRRCYTHEQQAPVIPGRYDYAQLESGKLDHLMPASQSFTTWLVEYEKWVQQVMPQDYRESCHTMFCRLTGSQPWLEPKQALAWLRLFACASPTLPRVKQVKREGVECLGD